METKKVIIVDENKLARSILSVFIQEYGNNCLIIEAENSEDFLELLAYHKPDIVLIDVKKPVYDTLKATRIAMSRFANLKVIAFSANHNDVKVENFIFAGVNGFLIKPNGPIEIQKAMKKVLNAGLYFSHELIYN